MFSFLSSRDDRAALQFEDLASALDAGLNPTQVGGQAGEGEQVLHGILLRRGVRLDSVETAVLTAGWRSGRAGEALRNRARARRERAEFGRRVWVGLRYPLLLAVASVLVALIGGAATGRRWLPILTISLAVAAAAAVFAAKAGLRSGSGPWHRLPILGPLVQDLGEIPYLEVLQALYGAGVPMLTAHPQAVAACPIGAVRTRLCTADRILQGGRSLNDALRESHSLCEETMTLLGTGERTGDLEATLLRALRRRSDVAIARSTALTRLIGHSAYVLAASLVIYLVVSFYSGYYGMIGSLTHH